MTIKGSGTLSISTDIVGEFGGSTPHSLGEYYRGGLNVPAVTGSLGIPASGAIKFSDFYGKNGDPDIVYEYPYAYYDIHVETNSGTGFSYIRNQTSSFNKGSGYGGTPWNFGPQGFGVLSLAGVNQNMPAFEGSWKSTFEGRMDIVFPYKTTGMRDISSSDTWNETTADGIPFTYLDEDWTTNFYNAVNNQNNQCTAEFQILPGYDY